MVRAGAGQLAATVTKFDVLQGAVVLDGPTVGFWGARGLQHIRLGEGRSYDLTCGVGGADTLFIQGNSSDHGLRVQGDTLTLVQAKTGSEIRLHASRGPRELVFDDGQITLGDLWRSFRDASALLGVVGEDASIVGATVADHVSTSPCVSSAACLPAQVVLQVEGAAGLETVYAHGAQVCLAGRLNEYRVKADGDAMALTRRVSGLLEVAYVCSGATLVFADGSVLGDALRNAVQHNQPWPMPVGEATPDLPRITAVALDVDTADLDWSEDWPGGVMPSGLFAGCRAGQVFEASVSLDEAVEVDGVPRLQLCVGGRSRSAHFSGGSGTDTLRFVYTVTEEDVAQGCTSQTKGLTLTGYGNLDVEVGPVLVAGSSIRPLRPAETAAWIAAQATVVRETEVAESDWLALISASERQLAAALAALDARLGEVDVAVDLQVDVDLAALESMPASNNRQTSGIAGRSVAEALLIVDPVH